MRVLIIGGGGREHALCWALSHAATVFCAPGNPGTALTATNLPLDVSDHAAILSAVKEHRVDLSVIGPEGPLAAGLADELGKRGHHVFGPSARAARIEASKAFAKDVMARAGVPTARSATVRGWDDARRYIAGHAEPLVVKASGLAAGKGVTVCATRAEAEQAAREALGGRFGEAGREIVIEEFLRGEELSVLALTDGERVAILPASQDHKRLGEDDTGPNTGGMGAYAPVAIATPSLLTHVADRILTPTLRALASQGAPYRGVLYAGLMISPDGHPSVIEFNCRFGDPETQVVLPAGARDLLPHLWGIAAGEHWRPADLQLPVERAAVTTVLASAGYPERPAKGAAITLPDQVPEDALLFHAGTARNADGTLRVAGGRVLCATGVGATVAEARDASQSLAERIAFEGKIYRRDIAWRELARA